MSARLLCQAIQQAFPQFSEYAALFASNWTRMSLAQAKCQMYRIINAPLVCETQEDVELIRFIVEQLEAQSNKTYRHETKKHPAAGMRVAQGRFVGSGSNRHMTCK